MPTHRAGGGRGRTRAALSAALEDRTGSGRRRVAGDTIGKRRAGQRLFERKEGVVDPLRARARSASTLYPS